MFKKIHLLLAPAFLLVSCSTNVRDCGLDQGERIYLGGSRGSYGNFIVTGEFNTGKDAVSTIRFGGKGPSDGYKVILHNGPIDGTVKSGSLASVRNLYRSLAEDGEWNRFSIAVRGKNISVSIDGTDVVCYTEPENPWRSPEHAGQILSKGNVLVTAEKGSTHFRNLKIRRLPKDAVNPCDTLPPVDEQTDRIIRLQQQDFPVIDWHVHLKGGLTKEQAHAMSMNYGINYGVAPNAGEGGVGRMLADDKEVYEYYAEVSPMPFLRGVQGEGRRWTTQFSQKALGVFDYLFTDAMTIVDKGRICRIYRPEEVHLDGRTWQQYMDVIVDQTVKILTYEPADIYANATYIPDEMNADYAAYWTDERVDKVLDVLEKYHIAMEISPRYKIPSFDVIKKAKARGIKFTFGTNNVDANFGRLEYALDAIRECGLTKEDMWFPPMSARSGRTAVDYNNFAKQ